MTTAWAIKDWGEVFEDFRSREIARLRWLKFDLDRNSEAYRLLVLTPAGCTAYGVFWALVLAAARCPERGVLADDKGPLTPERLAVRTGMPTATIRGAMTLLASPPIGWLREVTFIDGASTDHRRRIDGAPPNGARRIDGPSAAPPTTGPGASTDHRRTPPGQTPMPSTDHRPPARARTRTQPTPDPTAAAPAPAWENAAPAAVELGCATRRRGDGAWVIPEGREAVAAAMSKIPGWLPEGMPWITNEAIADLVTTCGGLTEALVAEVWRDAKASRKTLTNPAGWCVRALRRRAGCKIVDP